DTEEVQLRLSGNALFCREPNTQGRAVARQAIGLSGFVREHREGSHRSLTSVVIRGELWKQAHLRFALGRPIRKKGAGPNRVHLDDARVPLQSSLEPARRLRGGERDRHLKLIARVNHHASWRDGQAGSSSQSRTWQRKAWHHADQPNDGNYDKSVHLAS